MKIYQNSRNNYLVIYLVLRLHVEYSLAIKIKFIATGFTDLIFQSNNDNNEWTPGCRSFPQNIWNATSVIDTDTCIVLYSDPFCESNGWRYTPGKRQAFSNGATMSSFQRCSEIVTFMNSESAHSMSFEHVRLPLSSRCVNMLPQHINPAYRAVQSDTCVQLFSKRNCEGESAKAVHSKTVDFSIVSYRKCGDVVVFSMNGSKSLVIEKEVTPGCHSVGVPLQTVSSFSVQLSKCVVLYSKPHCLGNNLKLDVGSSPVSGAPLTQFDITKASYRPCDEVVDVYYENTVQGPFTRYRLRDACANFRQSDWKLISSIQNDACVTIYSETGCIGLSEDVFPGHGAKLGMLNNDIKSYQRCQQVKFYAGKNHKGLLYEDTLNQGCKTLPSRFWNQTESVKINLPKPDDCLKLFSLPNCKGYSHKVSGDSSGENAHLRDYIEGVVSFMKCDPKIYSLKDSPNQLKPLATIETSCKAVRSNKEGNRHLENCYMHADVCTEFFDSQDCSGEPLEVEAGTGVELPSVNYQWFRSCQKTLKFLGSKNQGVLYEVDIPQECTLLPSKIWEEADFIKSDACVVLYPEDNCGGLGLAMDAVKTYSLSKFEGSAYYSFKTCPNNVTFTKKLGDQKIHYEEEVRNKCTNLPSRFFQPNDIEVSGCVRLYQDSNCVGPSTLLKSDNSAYPTRIKSFRSCQRSDEAVLESAKLDLVLQLYENGTDLLLEKDLLSSCTTLPSWAWNSATHVTGNGCVAFYEFQECSGTSIELPLEVNSPMEIGTWAVTSFKKCPAETNWTTMKLVTENQVAPTEPTEPTINISDGESLDVANTFISVTDDDEDDGGDLWSSNGWIPYSSTIDQNRFTTFAIDTTKTYYFQQSNSQPTTKAVQPPLGLTDKNKDRNYVFLAKAFFVLSMFAAVLAVSLLLRRSRRRTHHQSAMPSKKDLVEWPNIFQPLIQSNPSPSLLPQVHQIGTGKKCEQLFQAFDYECPNRPTFQVYQENEVELIREIGRGVFGTVWKAQIRGEILSVKQVSVEHSAVVEQELETMSHFCHPHIVQLKGMVDASGNRSWIVMEYMEHGDLASILRRSDPRRCTTAISVMDGSLEMISEEIFRSEDKQGPKGNDTPFLLTYHQLLDVARQVAEGMKYLSYHRFVHRDLAARNCLVSAQGIVKISNFGLTRDLYTTNYYQADPSKKLPIRWMSPESIMHEQYTLEADVWSFGTLLWEVYTWGMIPYGGYENYEVYQLISEGIPPTPMPECPEVVRYLMKECWSLCWESRPNFFRICGILQDAISASLEIRKDLLMIERDV